MRGFALLAVLLAFAAPAAAQTVRGRVLDASSGRPVAQALVTVTDSAGAGARVRADDEGAYALALPGAGPARIVAERLGYDPASAAVAAGAGQTVELDLSLAPTRLAIAALTVTARVKPPRDERLTRVGFYERESAGQGRFVRGAQVDPRLRRVSDVMRAMLPGASFAYTGETPGSGVTAGRRGGGCAPRIFLDGVLLGEGLSVLDRSLRPEDLLGLEVYLGPSQLPPRFGGSDAACGAIVAWSGVRG